MGYGPALHREFRVRVVGAQRGAVELVDALARNMNRAVVPGVARFDYVAASGAMAVGEELVVRMPGPWDGPVRVLRRDPTSFRLGTLAGHLEAGQIEFAARDLVDGDLEFAITTWARAGDPVADVLYSRIGVAKQIQYLLWVEFCVRAAALAGGARPGRRDGAHPDRRLARRVSRPDFSGPDSVRRRCNDPPTRHDIPGAPCGHRTPDPVAHGALSFPGFPLTGPWAPAPLPLV